MNVLQTLALMVSAEMGSIGTFVIATLVSGVLPVKSILTIVNPAPVYKDQHVSTERIISFANVHLASLDEGVNSTSMSADHHLVRTKPLVSTKLLHTAATVNLATLERIVKM